MTLLEHFKRWRATRGYGVHSPMAFKLLQRVVRPPRDVAFYGEEILECQTVPQRDIRRARMLLRLVAFLQPAYVWTSPGLPQIYVEAIRLGGGVIRIYDGEIFPDEASKADMVVCHDFRLTKKFLKKVMGAGKSLVAFGCGTSSLRNVCESLKGGVALEGLTSVIAVNTADPQAHIYRLSKF